MHQSITAATGPHPPSPPPPATAGHLPILLCPGAGHLPNPGYSQPFDTHAVSYQNITTLRILLEIF